ncbi:MAG: hypothetical protein QNJ54_26315 [Prochloraceae cyanobacterium]|nr:hypothetical protein [Prochloraceae cyanobacterium]
MPTASQLEKLYILTNFLTFRGFQPINIVCIDPRTNNLFILAGQNDEIEIEIQPDGELKND